MVELNIRLESGQREGIDRAVETDGANFRAHEKIVIH